MFSLTTYMFLTLMSYLTVAKTMNIMQDYRYVEMRISKLEIVVAVDVPSFALLVDHCNLEAF